MAQGVPAIMIDVSGLDAGYRSGAVSNWAFRLGVAVAVATSALVPSTARAFPAVSAEKPVTPLDHVSGGGGETALASNGTSYLAAWSRVGSSNSGLDDVFAVPAAADGSLLASTSRLLEKGHAHGRVDVASDGSGFLVVWARVTTTHQDEIVGALVAADGSITKGPFVIASAAPAGDDSPAVAYGSGQYVVAWHDCRSSTVGCNGVGTDDVYAARVASDGSVLDPAGILVDDRVFSRTGVDVASDGSGFAVVFRDCLVASSCDQNRTPYVVHLGAGGSVSQSQALGSPPAQVAPASLHVAAFQGGALATWDRDGSVEAVSIDAAGTVGTPFVVASTTDTLLTTQAAGSDTGALVVWTQQDAQQKAATYAARLDASASALDSTGFVVGNGTVTDVVPDGSGWLVALGKTTVVRIDGSGSVLDDPPVPLSFGASGQRSPFVATANDGTSLVAWTAENGLRAARVDASGTMLDSQVVALPGGDLAQVVSNGTSFLAMSSQPSRIAGDGTLLDPNGLFTLPAGPDGCTPMGAASDGSSYALLDVCVSYDTSYASGTIIDPDGKSTGGFSPFFNEEHAESGAIAFDGSRYLALTVGDYGATGNHVYPDGTTDDNVGFAAYFYGYRGQYAVACGTGTCLIAAEDTSSPGGVVYGARVGPQGALGAKSFDIAIPGAEAGNSYDGPSVAFDGAHFVVAWVDYRNGDPDIYGNWVSLDGTVLVPGDVPLSALPNGELHPDLAAAPDGRVTLAYQRFNDDPAIQNARVYVRTIAPPGALGTSCEDDADCAAGTCSSGTCCDGACCSEPCSDGGAGASGAAGGPSDGGVSGAAGSAGAAGAAPDAGRDAGASGSASSPAPRRDLAPVGGCACTAPPREGNRDSALVALLGLFAVAAVRRRRGD